MKEKTEHVEQTFSDSFWAMNTQIEHALRTENANEAAKLFSRIRRDIRDFENRFSRFKPDSELSYVNSHPETKIKVTQEMMAILLCAEQAWHVTGGYVDAAVGKALISAGYSASFEILDQAQSTHRTVPEKQMDFSHVTLDRTNNIVMRPVGLLFDFGGIGKGYLLDKLAGQFEEVSHNFWISLGGDLIVSGTDEDGSSWPVSVQNPQDLTKNIGVLHTNKNRFGVATSGITKRKGTSWHHLIDPHTWLPSESDTLGATVIAPSALEADISAKMVLLRGTKEGLQWATKKKLDALAISRSGKLFKTAKMNISPIRK